jgi:hypothetical protein
VAGVESVAYFFDIQNADVGGEPFVQRAENFLRRRERTFGGGAEVRYLGNGVDAGIGTAGALDFELGSQEIFGSLAELALDGAGVDLFLPAAVFGPVIFES